MRESIKRWRRALSVPVAVLPILATAACGGREPSSAAERLARGREIIEQMGAKLGAAKEFSVTTDEKREVIRAGGEPQPTALDLVRGSGP